MSELVYNDSAYMSVLNSASLAPYIPLSRISVTLFKIIAKGCRNDRRD